MHSINSYGNSRATRRGRSRIKKPIEKLIQRNFVEHNLTQFTRQIEHYRYGVGPIFSIGITLYDKEGNAASSSTFTARFPPLDRPPLGALPRVPRVPRARSPRPRPRPPRSGRSKRASISRYTFSALGARDLGADLLCNPYQYNVGHRIVTVEQTLPTK